MTVTITRQPDPLQQVQWVFWYDERGHVLRLDRWIASTRPTQRHKFRPVEQWHRLPHVARERGTQRTPPALPPDIIFAARNQFLDSLRVVTEV